MSRRVSTISLVAGLVLVAASIACFMGSSDAKSRLANPQAVMYSLFNQNAAAQAQELRQMAEFLHYGGILSIVGGGVLITVGLVGIVQRKHGSTSLQGGGR